MRRVCPSGAARWLAWRSAAHDGVAWLRHCFDFGPHSSAPSSSQAPAPRHLPCLRMRTLPATLTGLRSFCAVWAVWQAGGLLGGPQPRW